MVPSSADIDRPSTPPDQPIRNKYDKYHTCDVVNIIALQHARVSGDPNVTLKCHANILVYC